MTTDDVKMNRQSWDASADEYQARNRQQIARQMFTGDITWGVWGVLESRLGLLGEVSGKQVLEVGCGGAQWSIALARAGARAFGLDLSGRQLEHARRSMEESKLCVPLVQAGAERVPFADESFDVVFADYGGFTFGDPYRTIPEAARVLRRGGLLAFVNLHPILSVAWPLGTPHATERLVENYFELFRSVDDDGSVEYQLPFGRWIELFRHNGLAIESMIETRPEPDAQSTYRNAEEIAWSRRWPAECMWRLRKE